MSDVTPGQAADWWVCDGPLPAGGQKITGPFATQELALTVRAYVEKAEGRTDLWVDDEAQEPQPAPELAAAEAKLRETAADNIRLHGALENVFAVLDRQTRTYAERISYARTLIRTALEGK